MDRTSPNGRVIGIDIIPAQPPKGVSTIQGNFLSAAVQDEVKGFLRDTSTGNLNRLSEPSSDSRSKESSSGEVNTITMDYMEMEKRLVSTSQNSSNPLQPLEIKNLMQKEEDKGKLVDVVLSDMSAPWEQTSGFWKKSLSNPYFRMMNTSGMTFRDHAGSMVWPYQTALMRLRVNNFGHRIFAMPLYDLDSIPYGEGVILSANSIRVRKTRPWKRA